MNTRSFILSALIAGALTGLLGNLPLLNLVNCFFCIFVWLGGALAVWLYKRYQAGGPGLTPLQGAGLGALTGIIGAVVGAIVYAIAAPLTNSVMNSIYALFARDGAVPFQSGNTLISTFFFLVIDLVLYAIFGALSGWIVTTLLWKKPAETIRQPPL